MALIVEDGSGKSDADAFASVVDYHTRMARTGDPEASVYGFAAIEGALREGAEYLAATYNGEWPGRLRSPAQRLPWPRTGASDNEGRRIQANVVPEQVRFANIELARIRLVTGDRLDPVRNLVSVTREKVGPIETEYGGDGKTTGKSYPSLDTLLATLGIRSRHASGGVVPVVRG